MAQTNIPFGSPQAVQRWSANLFIDVNEKSYFNDKFVGTDKNSVIQRLTELDQSRGDIIKYDLAMRLRNRPTVGDNRLEGNEENLRFYQDRVIIDQTRHAVSSGGKMSNQRVLHNFRKVAKDGLSEYFSKLIDELTFIYLSGARGINEDFIEDFAYAGHAGNPIEAPDSEHLIYPNQKNAKNQIDVNDKMSRELIEQTVVRARMMRAIDPDQANMSPVRHKGESRYVMVMSPYQEYDLRNDDKTGWLEINRAVSAADGRENPIFKGGLGMINNVILHSHESVIRFNDYGTNSDVKAARALFLGRQAGVVAYGTSEGLRFKWHEAKHDYDNESTISAGAIIGIKKTRFNNHDFGVIAVDTAAAPSA